MAPTRAFSWRILGLVMLGGALGAAARAALVWPAQTGGSLIVLVAATAGINILGAVALGMVVGALGTRHPSSRAFLGTGILGGFTTYSAFAVQVAVLAPVSPWVALLVAVCSLAVGLFAAGLGLRLGRRLGHRTDSADAPKAAE